MQLYIRLREARVSIRVRIQDYFTHPNYMECYENIFEPSSMMLIRKANR